jgi:hypothetical protein
MLRNQTPSTICASSNPASSPRYLQAKVPSRASSGDPFVDEVTSGELRPLESLTGPASCTAFVLGCIDQSRNYTSHVGVQVYPRDSELDPKELSPNNPLHSFGSPELLRKSFMP